MNDMSYRVLLQGKRERETKGQVLCPIFLKIISNTIDAVHKISVTYN